MKFVIVCKYILARGERMFDETQIKIIDAAMTLIVENGYSGATTKNIAKLAGVNECTIFRRFHEKKEIVLAAMEMPKWNPGLSEQDFTYCGELKEDLMSISNTYMLKVTPKMVKVSVALRTAELEQTAMLGIMRVPIIFKKVLMKYFSMMYEKGKIRKCDIESLSIQFISMNFGFVFLDASFGKKLVGVSKEEYIRNSIEVFAEGISI